MLYAQHYLNNGKTYSLRFAANVCERDICTEINYSHSTHTGHLLKVLITLSTHGHTMLAPTSVTEYQLRLGRQKAGIVHCVSGWMRGVQVNLWDPSITRAISERPRGASRRGAIQMHVYLTLPYVPHWIKLHKTDRSATSSVCMLAAKAAWRSTSSSLSASSAACKNICVVLNQQCWMYLQRCWYV